MCVCVCANACGVRMLRLWMPVCVLVTANPFRYPDVRMSVCFVLDLETTDREVLWHVNRVNICGGCGQIWFDEEGSEVKACLKH